MKGASWLLQSSPPLSQVTRAENPLHQLSKLQLQSSCLPKLTHTLFSPLKVCCRTSLILWLGPSSTCPLNLYLDDSYPLVLGTTLPLSSNSSSLSAVLMESSPVLLLLGVSRLNKTRVFRFLSYDRLQSPLICCHFLSTSPSSMGS